MFTNLEIFKRANLEVAKVETGRQVVVIHKKIALELLRRCVEKTPVDTGRAKGGWQLTLGSPTDGQTGRSDETARGEADSGTVSAALAALAGLKAFEVVWLSNNVEYIGELENGTSQQAPEGMLALSIEEVEGMFP